MRDQKKITVLGAGAVGVSIALYLQQDGHEVLLLDQNEPGSGCSYGNAGLIQCSAVVPVITPDVVKTLPSLLLNPDQPLAVRWRDVFSLLPCFYHIMTQATEEKMQANSKALASIVPFAYEAYQPLINAAGLEHMISESGELHVYQSDASFAKASKGRELRRARGVEVITLTAEQLQDMEPALSPNCKHGTFLPAAYFTTNPYRFVSGLARHFLSRGGRFLKARVEDAVKCGDGQIEIFTSDQRLKTQNLVIAFGAFSGKLAKRLGCAFPLYSERGYHLELPQSLVKPSRVIISGEYQFALSPLDDGVRLAGTAELAGLDAPPDYRRAERLFDLAQRILPGVSAQEKIRWMGHRPSTPDSLPVIDRSPVHRNIYFAFGHGHLGLTLGGMTGKIIADLIAERPMSTCLSPFKISRFSSS